MRHLEHTVTIGAPITDVWKVLLDVEGWVRLFPSTSAARVTESSPTHQIVALTGDIGGRSQSWVSRRDIDEVGRVIDYRQVETAPMMKRMAGQWRAVSTSDTTTELTITHDFEPAAPAAPVAELSAARDLGGLLNRALDQLAPAHLVAIKAEAERVHAGARARTS
ncbi:type II toxin-antitoxin system RatA family toxin [Embleya sp. NPDC050154]|uniref:type II toxin-antitoxin system RatA family toxin n=1 Tax=unclassified Embleya TaxID=2699296 RepID=UPI00379604A3